MIIQIGSIQIKDWKLQRTDIELRIRPNKDFLPKDTTDIVSAKSPISIPLTFSSIVDNTVHRTYWQANVPSVYLNTTTDADVGEFVRYIAEYWDTKRNVRIASFSVSNFILSPEMGVIVEWETVDAFSRSYHKRGTNFLKNSNIDLSDYVTFGVVNQIVQNSITNGDFVSETDFTTYQNQITNTVYDKTQSDIRYYTKSQVDSLFSSVSSAVTIDGVNTTVSNALQNYYTESEINGLFNAVNSSFSNYYTKAETYNKAEVDGLINPTSIGNIVNNYFYNNPPPAGNIVQTSEQFTTVLLSAGQEIPYYVNLGKSYYIHNITVSSVARIRGYRTDAYRTADQVRAVGSRPSGEHGIIFDTNHTSTKLDLDLSPIPFGSSAESPRSSLTPLWIKNMDTVNSVAITVKFTISKMEN